MRLPGSEKLEIIRLVEQSHLPARAPWKCSASARRRSIAGTTDIAPAGPRRFQDKPSRPDRIWNHPRSGARAHRRHGAGGPELSPRELATRFTDTEGYFVSESVYRLLKAHDLITSPTFIVIKAADEFKDKTIAPNQLWQTDFTYLKVNANEFVRQNMRRSIRALVFAAGIGVASLAANALPVSPAYDGLDDLVQQVQYGGGSYCSRLRRACEYKDERGERGEGNCRRYREECGGRASYCDRLRRACVYKDERGESGQGNCRRYREECGR